MERRRILFVLPSLRIGGAERVMTTLLRELSGDDLDLHLALVAREGDFLSLVPPEVHVHDLQAGRAARTLLPLSRLINRVQPHVVFSTAFRMNLAVTLLKPRMPRGTRVVIREMTVIDEQMGRGVMGRLSRRLARHAFARADAFICLSEFMRRDLQAAYGLPASRLRTVFNPVNFEEIATQAAAGNPYEKCGPGPHVVAVGRLRPCKGFDLLIRAFASLAARRPSARLWILGDGSELRALRQLAASLGVGAQVQFPGFVQNPIPWLKHADLFVLSSRFEGTPNVLLEAIACECPVIVRDHPGGTREVMQRTGQLARITTDLSSWDDAWFERPSPDVLTRARQFTDVGLVVRQYREALLGAPCAARAA